ncbi:hypothetical protein Lade_2006 [Legionella adelaidensis]|uniref:Uncharacterized protein n=1 Tax=Legionella adelaidensis TaxID=45056 RepID=A0A0W0R0X7_9GAMM|nr:hypothetical protein [Legionella adelaidensis]KTC64712.1 hypothetical protein Lade_2006 [Legionella adelaidensis]
MPHGQSKAITPSRATQGSMYPTRSSDPSMFHARLQPQPIHPPSNPSQVQVSFDPRFLFLFATLVQELQKFNELKSKELEMALEEKIEQKNAAKQEIEAARVEKEKDEKKFAEINTSLYL